MRFRVPVWSSSSGKGISVFLAVVLLGAAATAKHPVESFLESLDADEAVPVEARELIRSSWAECQGCDAAEFLMQGLAVISDEFRSGLEAYGGKRYEESCEIMGGLIGDSNTSIAVNAAAYQIKSLVALDCFREAGRLIEDLAARGDNIVAEYSYLAAEVDFIRAGCLLAELEYEGAHAAFGRFLKDHQDGDPRLLAEAEKILTELASRRPGGLGEIADLMGHCGRRLSHGDSGDEVQGHQQRIVELLDRLIEESEKQEQSDAEIEGQEDSRSQALQSPMQQSQLPGASPEGDPGGLDRSGNPGEAWGRMPPEQRERILQALDDQFPSRYRRLVEQYYEELAKKP
jgi:hypothetical protein